MDNFYLVVLVFVEVVDVSGIELGLADGGRPCGLAVAPVVPEDDVIALSWGMNTMRR